jgi:phosphatidylinositol alpha 1,6-mannosyltransferase
LRVALISSAYGHIADGVTLALHRLVAYLEAGGHTAMVVGAAAKPPAFADNGALFAVPSIALPGRPEYRLALGLPRRARRRLCEFAPDIVHITAPDVLGRRALRFARRWNMPVVASFHARWDIYLRYYRLGWLRRPLQAYLRSFFNGCDEVYAPLPSVREFLADQGVTSDIRLWSRGVDTERFAPGHRSVAWRERLGIAADEAVVLFVSRLVREKGLDTLAAALDGVRRRGIAHRSVIVGDGPERQALQQRLPDSVFTGFLGGEALAQAYASSDIFLFPSDSETFGNVTLEAMASGLPAVCADAPGSRSLVVAGITGFLAPPGCVDAFTAHLMTLIGDAGLRQRMAAAARERSLGFSWEVELARLLGYYREIARKAESGGRHKE